MIVMLPLSTEMNIPPSLGIDFPDELLLMLLTGIFILKWIHQPSLFPSVLLTQPLFLILLVHLVWIAICCIFSVDPILSIKFLLAKSWYIIPLVILPQKILRSQSSITKMGLCLLLPMGVVVIQALIRHAFYSFSFEGIKQVLDPFFRNHVNYSAMLICLLAVLWCFKKLTPKENKEMKWIYIGLSIGIAALLLSYSRGAWFALIIGIAGGIIIHMRWLKKTIIVLSFLIVSSVIWLNSSHHYLRFAPDFQHTVFHTEFSEHLQATITLKDVSNAERFYRWVAAANMIAANPITGIGPNNFYNNYKSYTENIFKTWVSNNPEHSSVHNYFLLTALEQGLIGMFLFVILLLGMLLQTQKLYHQFQNLFYRQVALTIGIVLIMITIVNCLSDLIETDKIGSLFWLCLGMIVLLNNKLEEERTSIA
jgi:O-antigen ligase